jgi:hypothetical protein
VNWNRFFFFCNINIYFVHFYRNKDKFLEVILNKINKKESNNSDTKMRTVLVKLPQDSGSSNDHLLLANELGFYFFSYLFMFFVKIKPLIVFIIRLNQLTHKLDMGIFFKVNVFQIYF